MSVGSDTVTPAQAPGGGMLERFFKFKANGTTLRRDTIAGLTTFMVMSYIIFVNPSILSFAGIPSLAHKGLPFAAVLTSTCLVAAGMTLFMGLFTNRAYALAPGLGINAVVAFSLVAAGGLTMPQAMGIVVMEGIVITILVLTGLRTAIFKAIPLPLKKAIAIGIGFFILFIGLVDGGVVIIGTPSSTPAAARQPDRRAGGSHDLRPRRHHHHAGAQVEGRHPAGHPLLDGLRHHPELRLQQEPVRHPTPPSSPTRSSPPPTSASWGTFNFGSFSKLGIAATILWVFSLMLSDFFDTMGTLIGVGGQAGYLDKNGDLPDVVRPLVVDSIAAIAGGVVSSSSATTYIESGSGVGVGGRTGWVGVIIALLFAVAMFFSPIAGVVPANATAPALIIVGYMMMRTLTEGEGMAEHEDSGHKKAFSGIDFSDLAFGLPAVLIMTIMPLTYSITNGIGAGFIAY